MAAIELIDRLKLTMENNEMTYFDMSKAFDTIDHTIGLLINKLTFYGIHGVGLDLIKSYLNNCYQFVEYGMVWCNFIRQRQLYVSLAWKPPFKSKKSNQNMCL